MSFVAQNAVWALPMRPASCKFVLLALAMRAGNKGAQCFPSVSRLVADTGLDRKTVMAAVSMLEEWQFIKVERLRGASNRYVIDIDAIKRQLMSLMIVDQLMLYPCQPVPKLVLQAVPILVVPITGPVPITGLNQYQKRDPTSTKNGTLTYQ